MGVDRGGRRATGITRRAFVSSLGGMGAAALAGCRRPAGPHDEQVDVLVAQPVPAAGAAGAPYGGDDPSYDASGFVALADAVPDAMQDIRYFTTFNFVGRRIDGYEEPVALATRELADALAAASGLAMARGYRLRIYDAYRPRRAVDMFVEWAADPGDDAMREWFYPGIDKADILPLGYVSERSAHSRGSAVDLTLFDMAEGRDVDMGGGFDLFDERSHPGYAGVTDAQMESRMLLRDIMAGAGLGPIPNEWWHFVLPDEPYPDTHFDFPVSLSSVAR